MRGETGNPTIPVHPRRCIHHYHLHRGRSARDADGDRGGHFNGYPPIAARTDCQCKTLRPRWAEMIKARLNLSKMELWQQDDRLYGSDDGHPGHHEDSNSLKLARSPVRVYGQEPLARLVVIPKIERLDRGLPLRGSGRYLRPRTPAVLRRRARERPSPLAAAHPDA